MEKEFCEKLKTNQLDDPCSICFCEYMEKDKIITLPVCKHKFHFNCLKPWLMKNHTCPVCRNFIRKNMIEFYHGPFEMPTERNDDQS